MNAREIADSICKDVVQSVHERRGRTFLVTTLAYPSGDLITLYVSDRGGDTFLSDNGMTAYLLLTDGVELTEPRREIIASICNLHDVHFDGQSLQRRFDPASAGLDTLALCQAIIRVSDLHYDRTGRTVPRLAVEVESLVEARIAPQRKYTTNWTDPEHDPTKSHPVDYHFNSKGVPSNLFVISSQNRVDAVTSIILFWRRHFENFKSACVLPQGLNVVSKARNRLYDASDVVLWGVGANATEIVEFAVSESAYVPPVAQPQ